MKSVALLTNWGNKDGSVSKKQASACEESGSRKTEGDWRTGLELVARILVGESGLELVAESWLGNLTWTQLRGHFSAAASPSVGGVSTFLRAGRAAENSTIYDRKSFCSASIYHKVTSQIYNWHKKIMFSKASFITEKRAIFSLQHGLRHITSLGRL